MRKLILSLMLCLSVFGSELHPYHNRELGVALPSETTPLKLWLLKSNVDDDLRVCWVVSGNENVHLQRWIADMSKWIDCSNWSIEENGGWNVYYGAAAFDVGWFRLTDVTEDGGAIYRIGVADDGDLIIEPDDI